MTAHATFLVAETCRRTQASQRISQLDLSDGLIDRRHERERHS